VKPQSSLVHAAEVLDPPKVDGNIACKMLLGAAIGEKVPSGGKPSKNAIMGFGVVLDLLDKDGLADARKKGHPWTEACLFDRSSIVSDFVPASEVEDPTSLEVYLEKDGEQRASLTTRELVLDVSSAIRTASASMTLYPGDIIGIEVAGTELDVKPGSRIEAGISSVSIVRTTLKGGRTLEGS